MSAHSREPIAPAQAAATGVYAVQSLEITPAEYIAGRARLLRKIRRCGPEIVALVGVTVFRAMFPDIKGPVALGLHDERLAGARVFVLPNPSGRNANYSYAEMLKAFRALARLLRIGENGRPLPR